jgi:hypothetical protein
MSEEKPSIKILNAIDKLKSDYSKLERGEINEEKLQENNDFLISSYPTLASKVKDNTLDMSIINQMLVSLDKMHSGQQSEHQASVDVGTLLRDKIVIPDMRRRGQDVSINNSISELSEEEAKKKVNETLQL